MSQSITITGVTVAAGSAQTLDLSSLRLPPIKSILIAEQIINPHTHVNTMSAMAVHGHDIHFNNADVADGATTRINAGTDLLGANTGADVRVSSVPDATGHGGIIQVSAGTPGITNAAAQPTRAALTVVTVTPTATNKIQRTGNAALSMWLTTAQTVNDILMLIVEARGEQVRP